MNWYHSARAVDLLAAEYVLGTLHGRARRRFEAVVAERPDVAARVADWEARLHRMAHALPPVAPSPALWARLAAGTGAADAPVATPAAPAAPANRPLPRPPGLGDRLARWWRELLAPVPAGALAFGLVAGLALPTVFTALQPPVEDGAELPPSYVGVLATPDGRPGLVVASLRHGTVVDLRQLAPLPPPPPGQTLFLWTLDAGGRATAVGPIPHGPFVQALLPAPAEQVFRNAVELGVTLEPLGATPVQPGSDWVVRGLCGKVWRVPG